MNKLAISINLLGLQGAVRATVKGEDCIILRLGKSRAKPHDNGKVYLNLDAVENRDGEVKFGQTHWVCEATTKEERAEGIKADIIGNGRMFTDGPKPQQNSRPNNPPQAKYQAPAQEFPPDDGEEIPW